MIAINLIPRRRLESRAVRRRARAWLIGAGAYAALTLAACVALRLSASAATPAFQADMDRVTARLAEVAREAVAVSRDTADLQRRLESARTVGCHPDWSLLLNALAARRGPDIMLESVEIVPVKTDPAAARPTPPRGPAPAPRNRAGAAPAPEPDPAPQPDTFALHIVGIARKPGQPFAFARELESLGVLDQVRIKETRAERLGSLDVVRFDLGAVIADRVEGAPR